MAGKNQAASVVCAQTKVIFPVKSYLSDRKQRVVIKGQASSWTDVEAGVPQSSILGP